MPSGNDATRTALLDRVGPSVDASDMHAADFCDDSMPLALIDDRRSRVRHGGKLRSSQSQVKRRDAKFAIDLLCALRNRFGMHDEPFSPEWLHNHFEQSGRQQTELVAFMNERGVPMDAAKVSKTLQGKRKVQYNEMPLVMEFFGYEQAKFADYFPSLKAGLRNEGGSLLVQRKTPMPNTGLAEKVKFDNDRIPIYGISLAGNPKSKIQFNGEIIGLTSRPEILSNVPNAYATYVHGDSMEPRYEAGEVVLVNPNKGYKKGNYVVAQIHEDDNDPPYGYVKKFVSYGEELVLEQLNPPSDEERLLRFPRKTVVSVHRIVGTLDE